MASPHDSTDGNKEHDPAMSEAPAEGGGEVSNTDMPT